MGVVRFTTEGKGRGQDLNLRPSAYEADELPDCSTPTNMTHYTATNCPNSEIALNAILATISGQVGVLPDLTPDRPTSEAWDVFPSHRRTSADVISSTHVVI